MDKGAHFNNCDFQVHSPRDINWYGDRPITNEERQEYAKEFIDACRAKGLDAVAITDHHDMAFYSYIKEASENECDENGVPINPVNKIVVFPGIELTLSTPSCQAILILDADYPVQGFDQILHVLSLTPNDPSEATTAQTSPISNTIINGIEQIYDRLNTIDSLKGRFIVFPNLSEGGRHTLLRAGNSEQYRKMPCVGGYLDGSTTQYGTGNISITSGANREYGYKSVGLLQTSDNRHRDFSKLGTNTTWVKWASPTAEALRQACLAKESRINQSKPALPQIYIRKVDVTNCKFLGSFQFEFNQQYNSLIGGRGTGKSTILEYVRWGLCDQTSILGDAEEASEIDRRRKSLIEKTLVPFDGEVRITFMLNGIEHIVKRDSKSKQILLKIGTSNFEQVKENEIRRILPIQAYSQKQLSNVGVRTEELKRFIEQPIRSKLNALEFQLSDNAKKSRSCYNDYLRKKELEKEIDQFNLEVKSINEQLENLRKQLTGISDDDQKIISTKPKLDFEQGYVTKVESELEATKNLILQLETSLNKYPEIIDFNDQLENEEQILSIDTKRRQKFDEIKKLTHELKLAVEADAMKDLAVQIEEWKATKDAYEVEYETVKQKASSNQQQLEEISRLEERLSELSTTLNERLVVRNEMGNPESNFAELRQEWHKIHSQKIAALKEQSDTFTELSMGQIIAEVTKSLDVGVLKNKLLSALTGSHIREDKIDNLFQLLLNQDNPLESWLEVVDELRSLAELKIEEDETLDLPTNALLEMAEFHDGNRRKVVEILEPETWLEIATTEIQVNPIFSYATNNEMGDVIPFGDASAGQQATALLTLLLNQPGMPLLIDQPEDDIDNRAIEEIIKNIWNAKTKRQLIFTSHSANMVVNGDAELVICCDYRESGNQTRGSLKALGAIDDKIIRDEITSVMEGGEKAFRLRKEKYGF